LARGQRRTAYVGLGSNVGDRLANLRAARERLAREALRPPRSSSVYETEPMGAVADQRDFLNACVAVEVELEPEELLDRLKAIERDLGRAATGPRHAPRTIDLDLLLLDGLERRDARLTLPHPEVLRRRFVLVPLLELDPRIRLPDGRDLVAALPGVADQRVDRLGAF
jgi:2-amino-4-hydroxy-6-hydroxymethyldihydropteridine diphosphokinase